MTFTYSDDIKNLRMDAVNAAIGVGGKLEIGTAGMGTILVTIPLSTPPFGDAVAGVLTGTGFPKTDSDADGSGQAAEARIRTGADEDVITGMTVGSGSTDVIMSDLGISVGQSVTIDSCVITHGQD